MRIQCRKCSEKLG